MSIINQLLKKSCVVEFIINDIINTTSPRPPPFSLWTPHPLGKSKKEYDNSVSDYTAWVGLFDKTCTKRHLPPVSADFVNSLPPIDKVLSLFERPGSASNTLSQEKLSNTTSMLFPFFAQWLTDSFLRTDPSDWHKNTSNHQLDLCQIYGLKETTTDILRSKQDGKLKSQTINGEEYLPYLYEVNGNGEGVVKKEFDNLPGIANMLAVFDNSFVKQSGISLTEQKNRKLEFFATGLDRANSTIGYTLMNTIFMRAHNKICDKLKAAYSQWDDDRLFQTTRNVLIIILLKIVVLDYVNHTSGDKVRAMPRIGFAEKQKWCRENWVTVELSLLYRWHILIRNKLSAQPDGIPSLAYKDFMYNPMLVTKNGISSIAIALSQQASGAPGLFNTPEFLLPVKMKSLKMSRKARLAPFNDYREAYGLNPLSSYEELNTTDESRAALKEVYKDDINKLEFLPGLWAECSSRRLISKLLKLPYPLFGNTMNRMVGADAFSHALTNPLLSENIYNSQTFSETGLNIIDSINSLEQLINMVDPKTKGKYISFKLKKSRT